MVGSSRGEGRRHAARVGAAAESPTREIDFLGRVDNTTEAIRGIVAECLSIPLDDGPAFESEIHVEPIAFEDRYPGVRTCPDIYSSTNAMNACVAAMTKIAAPIHRCARRAWDTLDRRM